MSGFFSRLAQPMARLLGTSGRTISLDELTARERYEMLDRYYQSNGLYDDLRGASKAIPEWSPRCMELRNPTSAAVEFYPSKLWPGALPDAMPIRCDNPEVIEAIHGVWKWSNWGAKKQVAARQLALYGDMFLRVSVARNKADDPKSVYLQLVNPKYVTEFALDERGVISRLRYDAPQAKTATGQIPIYTELWTADGVKKWKHTRDYKTPVDQLGAPYETVEWPELKFDFIPWVHVPFRDVWESATEEQRGLPLIWPVLTKIDAANLSATELHSMMYRYGKPKIIVSANQVDDKGRSMPPPVIQGSVSDGSKYTATDSRVYEGAEELWRLPGMSTATHLLANINWAAHLDVLAADLQEIKRDLPELYYYDIAAAGVESGRALLYRMAPAIDRALEVRGNAEAGLIRAQEMALSIGIAYGLLDKSLGTYDAGDFDHSFEPREVIMSDAQSLGETAKIYVDAGVPTGMAMQKYARWSEEDAAKIPVSQAAPSPATAPGVATKAKLTPAQEGERQKSVIATKTGDLPKAAAPNVADALAGVGKIPEKAIAGIAEKFNGSKVRR